MTPKRLLFLILLLQVILIQCLVIALLLNYIKEKTTYISINPADVVGDGLRVYRPLSSLEFFYEPPANVDYYQNNETFQKLTGVTYTFNSDSLHEPRDYPVEKATSTFRIVTLGDSYTFGVGLNTVDNYTELLEMKLNLQCNAFESYEIINLAVFGYDMQYSQERFHLRGIKYEPDLVTWMISDNTDFIILQNELEELQKKYYGEDIIHTTKPKDSDVTLSREAVLLRTTEEKFKKTNNPERSFEVNFQAMTKLRDLYTGPLLFFARPHSFTLHIEYSQKFNEFFNRAHTHFTDSIGNQGDLEYSLSETDRHPNKRGSQLIADDLFAYLVDEKLVPCN